jgi:hypothetical protein
LRRPSSTASYSAILLLHLSVSAMDCSHATYLSLMPEGDINIAAASAPVVHQAMSQCTCHGVSITIP